MQEYNPKKIEEKWQKEWKKKELFKTPEDATRENKMYILPQLPYPSGSGLHVGHAEVYTACDVYARYQRMQGKKVLQVIGWDSFGLPAENYAIKNNIHPKISTDKAIDNFRSQIKSLGISVDWDKEVGAHNPDYYKWTQWLFLLMYKRGLAYRNKQSVNWCDSCKTVLANEQVVDGKCERCDTVVEQKKMDQWFLKITDYADRLAKDLDKVDWPEETKTRQRQWIGRSEGAEVNFRVVISTEVEKSKVDRAPSTIARDDKFISVFTTRPDTLFGATYIVLSPDGDTVQQLRDRVENWVEVEKYIDDTKKKSELDRQTQKEKTGVELKGVKAVNPANGEEIPIWVADYVLSTYGTGAIMAVPAHDERDFEFASKFGLKVKQVVAPFVKLGGKQAVRGGVETLYRKCVDAIIEHPDGKKFLLMTDRDATHVPGGGVEEGETAFEALAKEVREETGYINYDIKSQIIEHVFCEAYRSTKDKNQVTDSTWYHIKLTDLEQVASEVDEGLHTIEWVDKKQVEKKITWEHHAEVWKLFMNGGGVLVNDGKTVNSDFLDGLKTPEAKEKMINWLEEKGLGKRKVQYKLRDWSVSRQRFWGAPIPMIENTDRREKKYQYIFIHGYGGNSESNYFPKLKLYLESLGHKVISLDLPNTENPKIDEQVKFLLENISIGEDTVILAHSLGGAVAMKMLETTNKKVAKVIFSDCFSEPKFVDMPRPAVEASCDWKFYFEKLKTLSDEFVLVADSNAPVIPREHSEDLANKLDARIVLAHANASHFRSADEPIFFTESIVTGLLPVEFGDMPVKLPDDVDFKPTGQSPLTYSTEFQEGVEKKYGKGWKREVDTLDTFMCSSWYYYRYLDPKNDKEFASPEVLKKWMPVDFYLGGEEHVNGHLLYARFVTKVLHDAGYIDFDEPFAKNRHQGLILGEDSRKMSKRWGNVVNPTDVINEVGADTLRMYEMFMGPLEATKPWSTNGVRGVRRFLDRVWELYKKVNSSDGLEVEYELTLHQTIKKVGDDLENLRFNTAIAKLMELSNEFSKSKVIRHKDFELFVKMLSPFAPHMAEELWEELGNKKSISLELWPEYDEEKTISDTLTIVAQVNGKVRDSFEVSAEATEEEIKKMVLGSKKIKKWLDGAEPKKVIYVKGKLVSIVV